MARWSTWEVLAGRDTEPESGLFTLITRATWPATSDVKGDEFAHAFLWTKHVLLEWRDLGTLTGDQQSGGILGE